MGKSSYAPRHAKALLPWFAVFLENVVPLVPRKNKATVMDKIRLKDKEFELFIPEKEINAAIAEMAQKIKADVEDVNPLFVAMLNGAFMFAAELMKQMDANCEITFARYSSYCGTSTTGCIREVMPVQADVKGRVVILLDDIIDTGYTMQYVKDKLLREGAASVRTASMLLKPDSLKCDLKPDYIGLKISSEFIVGYGLDYDGQGRAYRDIYRVTDNN